jgi:hypothetical protein
MTRLLGIPLLAISFFAFSGWGLWMGNLVHSQGEPFFERCAALGFVLLLTCMWVPLFVVAIYVLLRGIK